MNNVCKRLRDLSRPPSGDGDYDAWLEQVDLVEFLEANAEEEKTVVYAGVPDLLILSVLVPHADVDPPDVEDLLGWSGFPGSAYAARESESRLDLQVELSLKGYSSSRSLSRGEPLVFNRNLEGVPESSSYVEILQKFSHVFDLHYMEGRKGWCRLDRLGDIEKVVELIDFSLEDIGPWNEKRSGRAVLFDRGCLEEYAAMTGTVLVRMFDCGRRLLTREIPEYESGEIRSPETGIFYRCGVAKLDKDDPLGAVAAIRRPRIARDFSSRLSLKREDPFGRTWKNGQITTRSVAWGHEIKGDYEKPGMGTRLACSKELLKELLSQSGSDLLLLIKLLRYEKGYGSESDIHANKMTIVHIGQTLDVESWDSRS